MTRKSELLRSTWPGFDLDAAQWDIPSERTKMGKPHRVFLSRQAVEILRQVHELTGKASTFSRRSSAAACRWAT